MLDDELIYDKSDAAIRIVRHLKFPYFLLAYLSFIPKPIRDKIYDWIANNRYKWFGKSEQCWLPSKTLANRFIT